MAVVDYFLKIDGIDGESTDLKHKGEIQLASFSWGLANNVSAATGRGTGRTSFEDFVFTANSSKASPQMFLGCANGKHFTEAILSVRRANGEGELQDFMKITMSTVFISFYKEHGPNVDTFPTDEVGLNFHKIEFQFTSQSPTGGTTAPTTATVDTNAGG